MKRSYQLLIFCLIHILIFVVAFNSDIYGTFFERDFHISYFYSSMILLGKLPYLDFAVEYPPLVLMFMTLPRLVATAPDAYAQAFSIQMMLFDLLGLFIIAALSRRLNLTLWKTLAIYTMALLAIGPIITIRHDIIPAIIVLLALYTFMRGNHKISWSLLAVGMMTKIYPAIIAPIFLLYYLHRHQYRHIITGVVTFVITTAIIVVPPLLLSPEGFWHSLTYHAQRGLQIESTYASFLLMGQIFGLTSVEFEYSFGSTNVASPLADILAKVSPLVLLFSLAVVYWFFYKSQGERSVDQKALSPIAQPDVARIINYSLLAILVFMITNKVLSLQFIIWLFPLMPLVCGYWRRTSWLMFIMIGLMTYFVYPKYYGGLIQAHPMVVGMLFMRNVSLIILAFLLPHVGTQLLPPRAKV